MKDALILCVSGLLGTVGFSILFRIRFSRLPFAALGGLLSCVIYLVFMRLTEDDLFLANLAAAMAVTAYCEIFARVLKTPVTVLLLPSIVPLVPGGTLYYTMSCLVRWDEKKFLSYGVQTAKTGLGIAVGLIAVSLLAHLLLRAKNKRLLRTESRAHPVDKS